MSFRKLVDKTREGATLSEREIDELAKDLYLKVSPARAIFKTILILALFSPLVVMIVKFGLEKLMFKIIDCVILVVILVLSILILNKNKKQNKRIVEYLNAIDEFYHKRLENFEGFETLHIRHEYMANGYLQNSLCLFLTDGYDFFIFDDFLKETGYHLPRRWRTIDNKLPMLKVINPEFASKRPVFFKLADINSYTLSAPFKKDFTEEETDAYKYSRYTYVINSKLDKYCLLELNDRSLFKMSPELVYSLRRRVPKKENLGR